MFRSRLLLLAASLLLGGCSELIANLGTGATVSGVVKVPQSQKAGIFMGNAYRTQATIAGEVALNGASVQAYSGTNAALGAAVTTGSDGSFELKNVPVGKASFLKATAKNSSGGTLTVSAFLKPAGASTVRDINTASTIVAEKLRSALTATKLDSLVQTDVDVLEGTVAANLDTADIPDLSVSGAALTAFNKIQTKSTQVASGYQAIAGTVTTAALK